MFGRSMLSALLEKHRYAVRTQIKRNFCVSSLLTLQEFKAAIDHDRQGQFVQAIPLYRRTHEVVAGSTGLTSDMSVHVAMKLARSCIHAAEFNLAKKTLSEVPYVQETLKSDQKETILNAHLLVSSMCLLQGKWEESLKAADEAQLQLQRIHLESPDIHSSTASSGVHGLRGLSQLFVGEDADYEDDLITAARWSHTPEERAVAVNNLGTFNWMKLGRSMSRKNIPQYGARFMRRDLLHFSRTMGIKPADGEEMGRLSDKELLLLQEALSFWGEAVKECVTDSYSDTNAKQDAAAAMCGIISSAVPENPIGLDVREVPGVKKSAAEAKKISEDNCLSDRLKDVHFAMNYATILCNIAAGKVLLAAHNHQVKTSEDVHSATATAIKDNSASATSKGAATAAGPTSDQYKEQMSDEIASSVEMLSSAIKALDSHISQTTINPKNEVNSKLVTNALVIAPVLGRALGQLGALYLNPFRGVPPDFVYAEGLFRAALDKLDGPYAVKDNRYLYERAVVTYDYGTMLTEWDKRELSGADMIRDAEMIHETLPTAGEANMPFNSMFLLPIEL